MNLKCDHFGLCHAVLSIHSLNGTQDACVVPNWDYVLYFCQAVLKEGTIDLRLDNNDDYCDNSCLLKSH